MHAASKEIQEHANQMAKYFWERILTTAKRELEWNKQSDLAPKAEAAIALASGMLSTSCGTKYCPECVALHMLMELTRDKMNDALDGKWPEQEE